ncbi:MarR family winged helix-turn-helix transcriptional regulator [Allokutzneria sp. NRRL B-24872]|uniref:MarR family winged helix-turn-helix transcriptional regulator n=1 Tax=Allokutzneria sp. NRRL B-24872 TaxID=1137961 RepID=UPI000A398C30|nr:MarR family transcriptional regulator [Allokutzneria sp. NRRL B-24872]
METPKGVAFLLSQLGAFGAQRFAERLRPLEIEPRHVGLLRMISAAEGASQQELGERMGVVPSRMVSFIDDLEGRGLVERRRNPTDRRAYALHLTDKGTAMLRQAMLISVEHNEEVCAPLSQDERDVLAQLLGRLSAAHNLIPGVHPGYRHLR